MKQLPYLREIRIKRACLGVLVCILPLSAFTGISPKQTELKVPNKDFEMSQPAKTHEFSSPETIAAVTPTEEYTYRLGPGDVVDINVWNRPELSRINIIVSPDGEIALPRVGIVNVLNRNLAQVQEEITSKLAFYYENPEMTISIQEFHNNKAFVLGQVSKPGVVNFPGRGTLLEALALAGGLPYNGKETF